MKKLTYMILLTVAQHIHAQAASGTVYSVGANPGSISAAVGFSSGVPVFGNGNLYDDEIRRLYRWPPMRESAAGAFGNLQKAVSPRLAADIDGTDYLSPDTGIVSLGQFGAKCDGITDDNAAFVAALGSGNVNIQLPQGKTCVTSAPLTIFSNTSIDLNQGAISSPSTNGTILRNASAIATPVVDTTCSMTAGSTALNCTDGPFASMMVNTESVACVGANYADGGTATLFATVTGFTDSANVTLSLPAYQTVGPNMTCNLRPRNSHIKIYNGTIAGNHAPIRNNSNVMQWNRVDDLVLKDLVIDAQTGGYTVFHGDVTNVHDDHIYFVSSPADGIDTFGPATHVYINDINGVNADDTIVLAAHASNPNVNTANGYGPIKDVWISNITNVLSNSNADLTVRMEGGGPQATLDSVELHHITQVKRSGLLLVDTTAGILPTYASNILIDGYNCYSNNGVAPCMTLSPSDGTNLIARNINYVNPQSITGISPLVIGGSWRKIALDGLNFGNVQSTSSSAIYFNGTAANDIDLNNISEQTLAGAAASGYVVRFDGVTVGRLSENNIHFYGNHTTGAVHVNGFNTTSAIDTVAVNNVLDSHSTAGGSMLFNISGTSSINNLIVSNGTYTPLGSTSGVFALGATASLGNYSASNLVMTAGGVAYTINGTFGSGTINGGSITGTRFATASTNADWTLNGLKLSASSAPYLVTGGNQVVRGKGLNCTNICTGFSASGTYTLRSTNPDWQTDVTKLQNVVGDQAYNTNSGALPIGPAINNGSAWNSLVSGSGGVASINGSGGAFIFHGSGVNCVSTTCTFGAGPSLFNGLVETAMAASTSFTALGDSFALAASGSSSNLPATLSHPNMYQATSGSTSGNVAGWNGLQIYYSGRNPNVTWGMVAPNVADNASVRQWLGLYSTSGSCTAAVMAASDTPACSFVAIRYSTVAGDTTYQCVSGNGSSTTVVPIAGSTPGTNFTTMNINVGASNAVCTVGTSSATVSSTLPSAVSLGDIFYNVTQSAAAVHLAVNGVLGYSQSGSY
jgi:hypothetical protein